VLAGEPPSPVNPPPGCPFHPRCPESWDHCRSSAPALQGIRGGVAAGGHRASCFLEDAAAPRPPGP
jgi:oligopeptide/dipeptide ABC transporter ATP-binding protein